MALSKSMSGLSMYDENFVMVASIDFGTTFSGYAFSFKSNKNDIKMNKNWGEDLSFSSYKTPTSVLLDNQGRMLAFGFDAEMKYNDMVLNQGENSCDLYRHFKMLLHNQKHLTRKSKVQSVRGKFADAMDIFTHAVKYLKDHMLEAITKSIANPPKEELIRWVITVPAIWSEQSKSFMREVAYKAGMTKDIDSRQFMICLEPEAASIYCRQLDTDHFAQGNAEDSRLLRKPGAKYMIVDAGGGTIDITAHEIGPDGSVNELVAASGGPWGGTMVDAKFIEVLSQVLGKDFINRYQAECPAEWLEMRVNFERRKKTSKPDDPFCSISIPLSWGISGKYKEVTGRQIDEVIRSTKVQGIKFNNGNIIFGNEVVRDLFEPVMKDITNHVRKELQRPELRGVSMILLVGGFGESAFLQNALISEFSPKARIVCPSEAGIAIIKGAVIFGHHPKVIKSRIARKTYGQDIFVKFDPAIHDSHRKKMKERGARCLVFKTFVKKGESVDVGEVRKFTSFPSSSTDTFVTTEIYAADVENVMYPDDPTVKSLGRIQTNLPDTTKGLDREIETSVYFGTTEIHVECREITDGCQGEIAKTTIDFLAD